MILKPSELDDKKPTGLFVPVGLNTSDIMPMVGVGSRQRFSLLASRRVAFPLTRR